MKALHGIFALLAVFAAIVTPEAQQQAEGDEQQGGFRFKSSVELINVTATVSDSRGRFVTGLRSEDFLVYEDDQRQTVTHFSSDRVPVSLGILLDTSGSMAGEKIEAARDALDRFLYVLLDPDDEIFLYRFSDQPILLQDWTSDRQLLARALRRTTPNGGTAMYDAVIDALPLAQAGKHRKKALVLISDGNDTSSHADVREVKHLVRDTEMLVYAIGIDGDSEDAVFSPPRWPPFPVPFPPTGRGGIGRRQPPILGPGGGGLPRARRSDDRVNVAALRELTDDSGGRTEIVREPRDLDPASASIADELSRQYYLGYPSTGKKDGRWHSIRVEVRNRAYRVRARRGYLAN